jgi:hypothetical protein
MDDVLRTLHLMMCIEDIIQTNGEDILYIAESQKSKI